MPGETRLPGPGDLRALQDVSPPAVRAGGEDGAVPDQEPRPLLLPGHHPLDLLVQLQHVPRSLVPAVQLGYLWDILHVLAALGREVDQEQDVLPCEKPPDLPRHIDPLGAGLLAQSHLPLRLLRPEPGHGRPSINIAHCNTAVNYYSNISGSEFLSIVRLRPLPSTLRIHLWQFSPVARRGKSKLWPNMTEYIKMTFYYCYLARGSEESDRICTGFLVSQPSLNYFTVGGIACKIQSFIV